MTVCPTCQTSYDEDLNFCGRCGSDMRPLPAADTPDPWPGRLVDGRYRVLERVGQGGMGAVYRVEHATMGKIAAMKVLHGELSADKEASRRFRREAEAVSRLAHPNTVQVFDFGQWEGSMYLVMEYVRGEDLGALLRRDGAQPFDRAAQIMIQVCGALGEAHDLKIVHRDLKPENILIMRNKDGRDFVKVLDFGLAKIHEREELASVTVRGALVGTPFYMSPEQIRSDGEPDGRSDIYSLGAVLYRVLCGEPPFTARTPIGVLTKHVTEPVVPPRIRRPDLHFTEEAQAIVMRALEKRPEDRFQSVDELREALEQALRAQDTSTPGAPRTAASQPPRSIAVPLASEARQAAASGWSVGDVGSEKIDLSSERAPVAARSWADIPSQLALDEASVDPLSRSDFDHYERSLKRYRGTRLVLLPLFLAAAGLGAWYAWDRGLLRPADSEREPNDDPKHASLMIEGQPVRGTIGKRLSPAQGDLDVFRIPADPKNPAVTRLVRVSVTGLPNLDLTLELFGINGQLLATGDMRGVGQGETLPNVRIDPGVEYYVRVRESAVSGHAPTENVSDEYSLVATWRPLENHEEAEPNDSSDQAMPLVPGTEVVGFLDHLGDIDYFVVKAGPDVRFHGTLKLPPEVPARLGVAGSSHEVPATGQPFAFDVRGGDPIVLERRDPAPAANERPPGKGIDEPYRITLAP